MTNQHGKNKGNNTSVQLKASTLRCLHETNNLAKIQLHLMHIRDFKTNPEGEIKPSFNFALCVYI